MLKRIPSLNLLNNFNIDKCIHQSLNSQVYIISKLENNVKQKYILKDISKRSMKFKYINREYNLMNILPDDMSPNAYKLTKTDNSYQILMDYIEGLELFEYYQKTAENSVIIPEHVIREITFSILKNIETCHDKNIVHLDIKMDNIILKNPNKNMVFPTSLIDFGCSEKLNPLINKKPNKVIGTTFFIAPEMLRDLTITKANDIWSLGVITHALFTRRYPYKSYITRDNYSELKSSDISITSNIYLNKKVIDFLNLCLTYDYKCRPSATELLNHEWFKQTI